MEKRSWVDFYQQIQEEQENLSPHLLRAKEQGYLLWQTPSIDMDK